MNADTPKNKQLQELLKSYFTITFVSSLFGLAAYLFDRSFWAAFCLCTALQFVTGYIMSVITVNDYKTKALQMELEKLEKLSAIINCAFCNTPTVITFLPEEVPAIKCDKCQNISNVKLHFTVSRSTSGAPDILPSALKEPQKNHNIKY